MDDARRAWNKIRQWTLPSGHETVHGSPNLHFYTPLLIPVNPIGAVRSFNRHTLVSGIRRQLRERGLESPILFVSLPLGAEVANQIGEQLLIYYVADQHAAMPGVYSRYIEDLERELLSAADLIFVTSRGLLHEKHGRKGPGVLLPHGVDFEHFHAAAASPGPMPEELRHLPQPLLGFYGLLAPWVDAGLLKQVARAFPQASVVLIGPVWIDFPMPSDVPNLHWLGPRSYQELPRYATHFDVGLIPFTRDRLTACVNPLKLLEYLALGLPVVSTALPDLGSYGDLVFQARAPDDFVDQVRLALQSRTPESRHRRFDFAAGESWEARVNTIEQHIDRAIGRRALTLKPSLDPCEIVPQKAVFGE
jgi:glycosyltransferase involved in cell wall biosynthesis